MKSYVINLDRSPERLAAFTAQAQKAGITFERFSAIDGKLVAPEIIRAQVADRFEFQPINLYEAALFLSHRALWQRLVDSGEDCCAIFEDDVVLSNFTAKAYTRIEAIAVSFDVVKLETTKRKVVLAREPITVADSLAFHELKSWHGGAAAYVLSRQGAQKLLAQTVKVADPVDQIIFDPMSRIASGLKRLQLVPAVAIQMQFFDRGNGAEMFVSTVGRQDGGKRLSRHGLWVDARRMTKRLYASAKRRIQAANPAFSYGQVMFADNASQAKG